MRITARPPANRPLISRPEVNRRRLSSPFLGRPRRSRLYAGPLPANRPGLEFHLLRYALSLCTSLLGCALAVAAFFLLPTQVDYDILERYRFRVPENPSGGIISLALVLPSNGPYQAIGPAEMSWGVSQSEQYGTFQVEKLFYPYPPRQQDISLEVRYQATLLARPVRWQAPVVPSDVLPEPDIEVDDPQIQSLSAQLGSGVGRMAIYKRFTQVARALDWPTGTNLNPTASARLALETGIGSCNEFANLFVAVNRAAGVPARTISGLAFSPAMLPLLAQDNQSSHSGQAHAWAEFYTQAGWEVADPAWASTFIPALYFGRSDGSHLAYGEQSAEAQLHAQLLAWGAGQGQVIGSQAAPLKYVAAATGPGLLVEPETRVRKTWDGRWLNGALGFLLMALMVQAADAVLLFLYRTFG